MVLSIDTTVSTLIPSCTMLRSSWAVSHVRAGLPHSCRNGLIMVPAVQVQTDFYTCTTCPNSPSYHVDPDTLAATPIQSPAGIAEPACLTSCGGVAHFIKGSRGHEALAVQSYNFERDHWLVQAASGPSPADAREVYFTAVTGMEEKSCIVGFVRGDKPWSFDTRSKGWSAIGTNSTWGGGAWQLV